MARLKINYSESISVLGLNHGASPEEIRNAYRKLAKQYHPDVYQLDNGERFKEISSAYRFLKKHPDPPANSTYQHSAQQRTYYPPQSDYASKRRAYYRKKRASQAQQQREMYLWMLRKVKPFVLTVLIFNVLLSLDYLLPYLKEERVLINYVATTTRTSVINSEKSYEYSILLDDNQLYSFQAKKRKIVNRADEYTLEKSVFFGTSMKLVHHKTGEELTPPYSVYKIFGIIIPFIFLLQYLYFYRVKNYDLKLGLVAFMIVSVLMQISLTFF